MSKGNRGLEEITDVLSRRNWRLYETEEGKKTNRRTLYERSVEELEAKSKPLKLKTGKGAEKPRKLLEQVVSLQRHLDRRFAAKKGGYAAVHYSAASMAASIASQLTIGGAEAHAYRKSDIELIAEQRSLTKLLLEDLKLAKKEMGRSYGLLEEYRLDTSRCLHVQTRRYMQLERELEQLSEDETSFRKKMGVVTAESDGYAELVHAQGNVRLERQKLVNDYENTESSIMNSRISVDEIAGYQMVVQESEQILGDACKSLEQVSTQQAVAQAVLSAFAEGEASMSAAYRVMETLSSNIVTTHRTILGAFKSLKTLSTRISEEGAASESTTEASKGLYGNLRDSRRVHTQDAHQFAMQLFEKPMAEFASISGNGNSPKAAQPPEKL